MNIKFFVIHNSELAALLFHLSNQNLDMTLKLSFQRQYPFLATNPEYIILLGIHLESKITAFNVRELAFKYIQVGNI